MTQQNQLSYTQFNLAFFLIILFIVIYLYNIKRTVVLNQFKALEAMVEQVKPEGLSTLYTSALSNKSEKNTSKPRGSSSPFKCIGLGLAQQIKYEKVEELSAARLRIEELESQAVCRQKEVAGFSLRLPILQLLDLVFAYRLKYVLSFSLSRYLH